MKPHYRAFTVVGTLLLGLVFASPAWAQFPSCTNVCLPGGVACDTLCTDPQGSVSTCGQQGTAFCTPTCNNLVCTARSSCNAVCLAPSNTGGSLSTCGAQGLSCCSGDQLTSRVQICKAQFFNTVKNECVVVKRFDDTFERCDGSTYSQIDDVRHRDPTNTDPNNCPTFCLPGCEDICS